MAAPFSVKELCKKRLITEMVEKARQKQGLRVRWLELGAGHKFAVAPHAAALQLVEGLVADARENAEALQEAERPAPSPHRRERAHGAADVRPPLVEPPS